MHRKRNGIRVDEADILLATFNEKLLVGNGLAVMPLAEAQRSMKDMVNAVDDKGDFHSYILGHASKVPVGGRPEIRYEPHPVSRPLFYRSCNVLLSA